MCVCVLSGSVMDVCVQVEWECHGCVCRLSGRVMDVCVQVEWECHGCVCAG